MGMGTAGSQWAFPSTRFQSNLIDICHSVSPRCCDGSPEENVEVNSVIEKLKESSGTRPFRESINYLVTTIDYG